MSDTGSTYYNNVGNLGSVYYFSSVTEIDIPEAEDGEDLESLRKRAGMQVKVLDSQNKRKRLDDSDLNGKNGGDPFAMANSDDDEEEDN